MNFISTWSLFHYGEREHIEAFFDDGSIQIGSVWSYDEATHGPMIGDAAEGRSYQTLTDKNIHEYVKAGGVVPTDPFFGAPIFLSPGSSGNVVMQTNMSFNYAIFCVSSCLHRDLCVNFKPTYAAAIAIHQPFPFFHELTKAFEQSKQTTEVHFRTVDHIEYRSRAAEAGEFIIEALIKEPQYRHQAELRALWSAGILDRPFFRFKAPGAIQHCKLIPLEHMPDYPPGSTQEIINSQMRSAFSGGAHPSEAGDS